MDDVVFLLPHEHVASAEEWVAAVRLRDARGDLGNIHVVALQHDDRWVPIPDLDDYFTLGIATGQIHSFMPMRLPVAQAINVGVLAIDGSVGAALHYVRYRLGSMLEELGGPFAGLHEPTAHGQDETHGQGAKRVLTVRLGGLSPDTGINLHISLESTLASPAELRSRIDAAFSDLDDVMTTLNSAPYGLGALGSILIDSLWDSETIEPAIRFLYAQGIVIPYSIDSDSLLLG